MTIGGSSKPLISMKFFKKKLYFTVVTGFLLQFYDKLPMELLKLEFILEFGNSPNTP